ncbi:hypothetical protein GOBAR_AA32091 [Gossypium barbadense]|uniref:Uncharacterized protein n=1 Tax=Gossypium barbadense TaxID=3634 RepID=A0A2P5WBX4_GOSBA|nr:hypothetical protein GOBAR_AA32091 [Gossypium barbadense]
MEKGRQHIHNSIWLRYATQDPDRTLWVQLEQGESMKRSVARQFDAGSIEPANTHNQNTTHMPIAGAEGTMKRGHTTNAWHENYEGQNPTGTWSSQDRAYKLNLHPPVNRCRQRELARPWQGQGADGSPTWAAQGVPNMTGENEQAKLEPIAMHKAPTEIFARYRKPGPGVVGYISMGTGLTGRKIITPATSVGDRPTTVGESLRDYLTPVGAADAPHLGLEGGHVGGQWISTP